MKKSKLLNSEDLVANNIKRMESIVKILEEEGVDFPQKLHDEIKRIKKEVIENKVNGDLKNNSNNESNHH